MTTLPLPLAQAAAAVTPLIAGASALVPAVADGAEEALVEQVRRQGRKFTKVEALYFPAPVLPPLGWRYECQTCRFWEGPGPGRAPSTGSGRAIPTCAVVGVAEDPWGGEAIHPLHWCAFWLNQKAEPPLRWLAEWADPGLEPARGEL